MACVCNSADTGGKTTVEEAVTASKYGFVFIEQEKNVTYHSSDPKVYLLFYWDQND